jgi:TatD DNase family protein
MSSPGAIFEIHELVDIGVNLTHDSFDADLEATIGRALAASVTRMIVTGTDARSNARARALAAQHRGTIWCTAGIHPHHATELDAASAALIREHSTDPLVVAVGECGLDYFRDFSPRPKQREAFVAQLEIAVETALPVFLHQRDAHADFVAIIEDFAGGLAGGVAHCFTGGRDELDTYLELGLHIGVTGWVCDERRGDTLRKAVPHIPLERLLLETDAPYLLPRDLEPPPKARRNEPAYLRHILDRVSRLRNTDPAVVADATTATAIRLFGLGSTQA